MNRILSVSLSLSLSLCCYFLPHPEILGRSSRDTKDSFYHIFVHVQSEGSTIIDTTNTEDDLTLKQHRCANLKSHINYKYLKTGNNLL